jgi:threonyl-tRNA synthetase
MSQPDITKLRHSAAHLLAMAVVSLYKDAKLGTCGVSDTGFHYDIEFDEPLGSDELAAIQAKMLELSTQNLPFTTQVKSKEEVEAYFANLEQPYKREIINDSKSKRVDLVVIGDNKFADMCVDGVVPTTALLEHVLLTDVSGAYWKGDDKRSMLSRISGVCFFTQSDLDDYVEFQAELQRRDHRNLGKKLGFFSVDPDVGTGLVFWHPRGAYVKEAITNSLRHHITELKADFVETPSLSILNQMPVVQQPQAEQVIAKNQYEEGDKWYALRQQSVGAHILQFGWKDRSYRDLPWRVAEIGKYIRYEKLSELDGLHRSREFTQDTVTTICTRDQVEREVEALVLHEVQFLRELGLNDIDIQLNQPIFDTKNQRQDSLFISGIIKGIARRASISITENSADPEISEPELLFKAKDSLKQKRGLGKIQIMLDLPFASQLSYAGKDGGQHVPVLIRTTFAGSIERLISTLLEHYAGVLPLWMTFEQVRILPVTNKQEMYADKIVKQLQEFGIRVTLDADAEPLEGKIKQAEEDKVPYMLIVGEKEQSTATVSVRIQGKGDIGLISLDSFIREIQREVAAKSIKTMLV